MMENAHGNCVRQLYTPRSLPFFKVSTEASEQPFISIIFAIFRGPALRAGPKTPRKFRQRISRPSLIFIILASSSFLSFFSIFFFFDRFLKY